MRSAWDAAQKALIEDANTLAIMSAVSATLAGALFMFIYAAAKSYRAQAAVIRAQDAVIETNDQLAGLWQSLVASQDRVVAAKKAQLTASTRRNETLTALVAAYEQANQSQKELITALDQRIARLNSQVPHMATRRLSVYAVLMMSRIERLQAENTGLRLVRDFCLLRLGVDPQASVALEGFHWRADNDDTPANGDEPLRLTM